MYKTLSLIGPPPHTHTPHTPDDMMTNCFFMQTPHKHWGKFCHHLMTAAIGYVLKETPP